MSALNKEDLGYLGIDFQYAVLRALIEDPELLQHTYKFIDQNVFSDPYLRRIVGSLKDYFKAINMTPSYKELKTYMRSKSRDEDDVQAIDETIEKARNSNDFTSEYVVREFTEFMRWRKEIGLLKSGLEKANKGWDERTFNMLLNSMEELRNLGENDTVKWRFDNDTIKRTLEQTDECIIPLFIPEVDELVGGGLPKKEVGLMVAPTGVGKTTFGTILANNAVTHGYRVLQIYFEDQPEDINRKHLAMTMNSRISKLKGFDPQKTDAFIQQQWSENAKWTKLSDNLVMLRMADKDTTVEDIENELIMLANTDDFRPDMIIIDYFACLKFSANPTKNIYEAQSACMKKIIRNIAFKYNTAVWVLNQMNREGTKDENSGQKSNVAGSYDATTSASIWLELRKTKEQAQARNNRADLIIVKARHGASSVTMSDILFDNGRMIIDCRDWKEYREDEMPEFKLNK